MKPPSCGMFLPALYLSFALIPLLGIIIAFIQRSNRIACTIIDLLSIISLPILYVVIGEIASRSCIVSFGNIFIASLSLGLIPLTVVGLASFCMLRIVSTTTLKKDFAVLFISELCISACFQMPLLSLRVDSVSSPDAKELSISNGTPSTPSFSIHHYPFGGLVISDGRKNHYVNIQTTFYRWHNVKHLIRDNGTVLIRHHRDFFIYDMKHERLAFVSDQDSQKRLLKEWDENVQDFSTGLNVYALDGQSLRQKKHEVFREGNGKSAQDIFMHFFLARLNHDGQHGNRWCYITAKLGNPHGLHNWRYLGYKTSIVFALTEEEANRPPEDEYDHYIRFIAALLRNDEAEAAQHLARLRELGVTGKLLENPLELPDM